MNRFDLMYAALFGQLSRSDPSFVGFPRWETGRPQPAIARLLERGWIESPVIDLGCGTGENALLFAAAGHQVTGVDIAATAIERARAKADERGLSAEFRLTDALDLALDQTFATGIDSGVFHVFDDVERARYVTSIERVLRPGGRFAMLAMSEREPTDWGGPKRRVRREEIEAAFRGWTVRLMEREMFETTLRPSHEAWLAVLERGPLVSRV